MPKRTLRGEGDETLVENAVAGDCAALNELLARFRPKALDAACGFCDNLDEAEDLVQDTCIKAWQNIGTLGPPFAFWPWLRQIMSNTWADKTKAVESAPWINHYFDPIEDTEPVIVSLDSLMDQGWDIGSEHLDPAAILLMAEERQERMARLKILPTKQRGCCELVLKGYTYQEIADILDITYQAVRLHVSRGTRRLMNN